MMRTIASFAAGSLLGMGLLVSQMTNPAKALAFLDIFGNWDPSLAFVMGGALLVTLIGYKIVLRRKQPVFAEKFRLPMRSDVDRRLIGGTALFGIGWGLAGLCPGPAIASVSFGGVPELLFTTAMVGAMFLTRRILMGSYA